MPVYIYRAVTNRGLIVRNKVEEVTKQVLVKRLKENGMTPIEIVQIPHRGQKKKKNVTDIKKIIKDVNTTQIDRRQMTGKSATMEKLNLYLAASEKITSRDIVIFTENFYLLKKANFNNIHALSTIIQSTENITLKGILEDILAGVEARRLHVYDNGILFRCIPIYIHKYDKSRRIIRFTNKFIRASSKILRRF